MERRVFVEVAVNGSTLQTADEVILSAYGPKGGTQACIGMTRENAAALAARINAELGIAAAPAMLAALERLTAALASPSCPDGEIAALLNATARMDYSVAPAVIEARAAIAAAKGA